MSARGRDDPMPARRSDRAHRDVGAFDERARGYEAGRLGRLHHEIAERVIDVAVGLDRSPRTVLDVGCGTGHLLRGLGERLPGAELLAGIDPAAAMIDAARDAANDPRLTFTLGSAEQLPHPDAGFDLVIAATSFDHWHDQAVGLRQCARVLAPGGTLLLADLFSVWLAPTLVAGRRGKARTRARVARLLTAAGFSEPEWHGRFLVFLDVLTATTS